MKGYTLSPAAQDSLEQIKVFSLEQLGTRRTRRYLEDLAIQFNELATNPHKGQLRPEIKKGYFSFFVGSHTIYYRIKSNVVEIIDVLHQSMEPDRYL